MNEKEIREKLAVHGRSLYERGYTFGATGNMSARFGDGFLITPTNTCLGLLEPERIARIDGEGRLLSGDAPSREIYLHLAVYNKRPEIGAVVHLHSAHAVAVSCMEGLNPEDVLPPITPYYIMKIGRLPLVPYFRPGDIALADAVEKLADRYHAFLLAHHGTVTTGKDLDAAVFAAEEIEETAKLFFLLQNRPFGVLTEAQVEELRDYSIK